MKRLPGRIPGLECGQHVTRYILAVVVAGYLVVLKGHTCPKIERIQ